MKARWIIAALTLGYFFAEAAGQEAQAPTAAAGQGQAHNTLKRAIRWKAFEYSCDGGTKVSVYLSDSLAKVLFEGQQYLMKQTMSADGNRYSDGKVVWWGKGEGGFLQEDKPEGDGKMLAKDCKLERPNETEKGVVTGTVSYRQRIALPPNAVLEVQLREMPVGDARERATLVAEEKITLGDRQVPVGFALKYEPAKINAKRVYAVTARILVGEKLRFSSSQGSLVLTQGNPSHVDVVVDQAREEDTEHP